MSKAVALYIPTPEIPKSITLELSPQEAQVLTDLLGKIGGCSVVRKTTSNILQELNRIGFETTTFTEQKNFNDGSLHVSSNRHVELNFRKPL